MKHSLRRHASWISIWLVLSAAGTLLMAQYQLSGLRNAFEADALAVHRLLSQRTAQHDTLLSTLALLRTANEPGRADQRFLPAYPQVLSVQRRTADATWPEPSLMAAETESRKLRRAALADVNLAKGHYQLVLAAEPASYAVLVDARAMVPWKDWPMSAETSPVRITLGYDGQAIALQPGIGNNKPGGWHFHFGRRLAPDSQPFEMNAQRRVGWEELPWGMMLSWSLMVAIVLLATRALLRQRKDRLRAEELLRLGQVARLSTLGELAAGMAHELKNPLDDILASTQTASRVLNEDPPDLLGAQMAILQAAEQAQHATSMLNRLSDAVQQPNLGAQVRDMDLQQAARKAVHVLQPELRRRSVEPEILLTGPPFLVRAEPVALDQIIHNLLMNALQALDQVPVHERQLVIALGTNGQFGQLSMRDSGPGIPTDVLPHIFEPFFTARSGGLGMGLSQSESLASGMGGTLLAFNRTPRGAEFNLQLPLAALH